MDKTKIVRTTFASKQKCLLVAHNASFDTRFILKSLKQVNLMDPFKKIVVGISDTLVLFRSMLKDRTGSFSLGNLAEDYLHDVSHEKLHDGKYDVFVLNNLIEKLIPQNDRLKLLLDNAKTIVSICKADHKKRKSVRLAKTLSPLKGTISTMIITRLADSDFDYNKLIDIFLHGKEAALEQSLRGQNCNTRIIKTKPILTAIVNHFSTLFYYCE